MRPPCEHPLAKANEGQNQNQLQRHGGVVGSLDGGQVEAKAKRQGRDRIEIAWPGGKPQVLENQAVDRMLAIKEPL